MTDIDFEELDKAVQSAIDDFSEEDTFLEKTAPTTVPSTPIFSSPRPGAQKSTGRSLDSFSSPKAKVNLTPTVKPQVVQPEPKKGPVIDIINPIRRQPINEIKNTSDPVPKDPPVKIEELDFIEAVKESPFIENLKVDKRPLGAFSNILDKTPAQEEVKENELVIDLDKDENLDLKESEAPTVEAPTYVGGVDEAHELPPELHQDVLAVEATGMIHEQEPLSNENVGLEATQDMSIGAKTEEKTPEESVYTSEAYTKPLAHPQKKKSGWLRVVLIVLLLILGATGGAAAYYFIL